MPPDDRLREAIQAASEALDCLVASFLAMTKTEANRVKEAGLTRLAP
jgi:hypothetical protein